MLIMADLPSERKGPVFERLCFMPEGFHACVFQRIGLQGEDLRLSPRGMNLHVCSVATSPQKYSFFNGPPTFKRNCCHPDFQRGQKSVVLVTKQETQSPFRSFELAGRAGPEMITFL